MKLIADSGATKTQWCGISGDKETTIITTAGLNPNFVSEAEFIRIVSVEVVPYLNEAKIDEVWFYGAGCSGIAMENKIIGAIISVLPSAKVYASSDLLGAARGLLGNNKGLICLIGTGSNSGYYNGEIISVNVPPLGFILGDEGSGASLGKKILADFIRGIMPSELSDEFREKYGAEKDDIVGQVYRGVFPSRFIGSFVEFLKDNISHNYCRSLVKTAFEEFVQRNLRLYKITYDKNVAVTGSVAWHFREILEEVLRNNDFIATIITREPIGGLIDYHKMNR